MKNLLFLFILLSTARISGQTKIGSYSTSVTFTNDPTCTGCVDLPAKLSIADALADGSTKGAATFFGLDFNSSSGLISIDYPNAQLATGSQNGFVSYTGSQTFGGTKTFVGRTFYSDGAENAPAISFTSNTNGSGFSYTNGTNDKALSLSINGSYGLEFLAGNDAFGATTYRQLNLTSGANFIDGLQHLNLNIVHLSYNNDQDGGISVSTYTNGDGHTCTFAGRSANGTELSPSQSVQYDRLAEFSGKGFHSDAGPGDWDASNRGVYGIYSSESHTTTSQGAYCAISTTANGENSNHISMVINDKGNAGLTDQKDLTSSLPSGFGTAKTDRFFSIEAGSNTKDVGLFMQNKNAQKGMNIWLDNSTDITYFDNLRDDASGAVKLRLKTYGASIVTAMTANGYGTNFGGGTPVSGEIFSVGSSANLTVNSSGIISKYNNISTISNGVPAVYAMAQASSQTAAKAATTIYTTPAIDGFYRISWVCTITNTTAASSILGPFQISYTGATDNTVKTWPSANINNVNQCATNSTATGVISGCMTVYAKASTNIQFIIGYTSGGGTMTYDYNIICEKL